MTTQDESRPKAAPESMRGGYDETIVTQAASVDLLRLSARGREIWDAAWRSGYLHGREAERAEVERQEALLWQQAVRVVHNMARLPEVDREVTRRAAARRDARWSA